MMETNMAGIELQSAIVFATLKHKNQKRKGTDIPYIVHPMEVMQILSACNCRYDVIITGVLHDTLEDTDTTPEEIESEFGKDVLNFVQGVSEDKSKTWEERKSLTVKELADAPREIILIRFADALSNLRSIYRDYREVGDKVWDRFNADIDRLEWYYDSLADIFKKNLHNDEYDWGIQNEFYKEYKHLVLIIFEQRFCK